MRARKPSVNQSTDKKNVYSKAKMSNNIKESAFSKRRPAKTNKENIVQITEPLDPTLQSQKSKEFLLSKDSVARTSRGDLMDIKISSNKVLVDGTVANPGSLHKGSGGQLFDRRLSLKCLDSHSQQF